MNRTPALYLRVGLLVLAGLVMLVGFVLFLANGAFSAKNAEYETYIQESVQGLDVGSSVRYRGVQIGRVTKINLVASQYRPDSQPFRSQFQLVMVRFAVDFNKLGFTDSNSHFVDEAVQRGLRVRLASQGLTGGSYLELDFADPARYPVRPVPWKPEDPVIPSIPSTVAQVQTAAEQLLTRMQQADLPGLVDNFSALAKDLRVQTESGPLNQTLVAAAALMDDLHKQLAQADIPGTMAQIRQVATSANQVLSGRDTKQILANTNAAMTQLKTATAQLPAIMAALETTLRSANNTTGDVQAEVAPLLRDLRSTVGNLRDTTDALRRSPSQFLFSAPPPGGQTEGSR